MFSFAGDDGFVRRACVVYKQRTYANLEMLLLSHEGKIVQRKMLQSKRTLIYCT